MQELGTTQVSVVGSHCRFAGLVLVALKSTTQIATRAQLAALKHLAATEGLALPSIGKAVYIGAEIVHNLVMEENHPVGPAAP
jgi:hypothetical protein